jgi:hypothetical protein
MSFHFELVRHVETPSALLQPKQFRPDSGMPQKVAFEVIFGGGI